MKKLLCATALLGLVGCNETPEQATNVTPVKTSAVVKEIAAKTIPTLTLFS